MDALGKKIILSMFVQYAETDWQFAKRSASRLNTVVIPNSTLDSAYLSIGLPERGNRQEIQPIAYSIRKQTVEYLDYMHNGFRSASERDVIYYTVETRDIYDLGDPVSFKGRQLYVYSLKRTLRDGELYHEYILKESGGFCNEEHFNTGLIGASLCGTVKDVKKDRVRIDVENDVRQTGGKTARL